MKKKKQPKQPVKQLSPNEYIITKARTLPIYKCWINSYWLESGLTTVIVARQHSNCNFTIGVYRIDTFKYGLFKSYVFFNRNKDLLDDLVLHLVEDNSDIAMIVEIDYTLVHNIIYGGEAFAKAKGYKPDKAFEISKYILKENDGSIEYIEINFGKNEGREQLINEGQELYIDKIQR